jgi:hypothetical protein
MGVVDAVTLDRRAGGDRHRCGVGAGAGDPPTCSPTNAPTSRWSTVTSTGCSASSPRSPAPGARPPGSSSTWPTARRSRHCPPGSARRSARSTSSSTTPASACRRALTADEWEEAWHRTLAVNLTAQALLVRACHDDLVRPELAASGGGRIVNVASTEGLGATRYMSPYTTSKHGVIGLTRSLALEYGDTGVTVNCICPGPILTGMTESIPRGSAHEVRTSPCADATVRRPRGGRPRHALDGSPGSLVPDRCRDPGRRRPHGPEHVRRRPSER